MNTETFFIDYNLDAGKKTFRILHACDLHLTTLLPVQNGKTLRLLSQAIDKCHPDLVVVNGDLVYMVRNSATLNRFARFMEDKGVYWAYALGNHDVGVGRNKIKFVKSLERYPHCMFLTGDKSIGVGNYIIKLVKNDTCVYTLAFVDTSNKVITQSQTKWFCDALQNIDNKAGNIINNITFMHVPLPALKSLASGRYVGDVNKRICALNSDGGFFDAVKGTNKNMAIFNGHDHTNNFSGVVDNVYLMSALASGYGGYNKRGFPRGYVCIDIDLNNDSLDIKTFICDRNNNSKKL